jgi:Ser/Thr protein kinase RdoA (MazF antagonist)
MRTEPDEVLPVLARWPLPRARLAGPLPGSARNVNVLVEEPGGARYVLRCCKRNPWRDRILFQLDFQDHLRRRGVPTAEVVTTRAGERCVASDAGFQWILFRFVEGHAYDYGSRAQLRSAARCLAGLHVAAADFAATPVPDDTIPDLRRWWTHGDEELTGLHDVFADSDVKPELDFLGRWHDVLVRDLPLGLVDELPGAWLHADFHGQNLVFAGSRVRGVFDFDVVHRGWRLADIGYAMFCFAREDRASSVIRADAARAFLDAFTLTELERKALPYFVVATQARTAPRYRVRQREGADITRVLRSHVARMRALGATLGVIR